MKTSVALPWLLLASLALGPGAGAAGKPGKPGKPPMSPERRAAEQAAAVRDYLGRDMIFISAPGIESYLNDIATKLLASQDAAPPVPKFLIQSTDEFSVFTDTRGNIVVGSEVLRQVESEDELAAAISHELAHVIASHAETKNLVQKLPFTVETAQLVAVAVDSRGQKATARPGEISKFAGDSLATTQAAGTIWSDLIAPGWNRQQEREADLAGVDMVRAAGYDPAAFSSLFARIDAAQAVRSARVEALRQDALKRAQAGTPAADASKGDALVDSLKTGLQTSAVEAAFTGLAGWGTDYDTPEQRTTAVLEHVQNTSTGRRDKTPRSPRFDAELRSGRHQQLLDADRSALAMMAGMNSREPGSVRGVADALLATPGAVELSPHLNLAIGTWQDTVQRKPAEAEQRAMAWSGTELAPRAAYLWRASYQIQKRDYQNAMSTLETGAGRLGERSLFLPQMIAVARGGGDLSRADELGMECSRTGTGLTLSNMAKLLEQTGNKVASQPTGVYAECVAALGYDPVQRREQALKTQPAAGQKELSDFTRKLTDKLNKALGK
ncbi:MAG: M48 family metalloprotease [Gammaproteobacteria bacterium]